MNPFSLAANAALVTGSSKGIGLAIANGLHQAGAAVVYHGNTAKPDTIPAGCSFVTGDLLAPDASAKLVAAAFAAQPRLDLRRLLGTARCEQHDEHRARREQPFCRPAPRAN